VLYAVYTKVCTEERTCSSSERGMGGYKAAHVPHMGEVYCSDNPNRHTCGVCAAQYRGLDGCSRAGAVAPLHLDPASFPHPLCSSPSVRAHLYSHTLPRHPGFDQFLKVSSIAASPVCGVARFQEISSVLHRFHTTVRQWSLFGIRSFTYFRLGMEIPYNLDPNRGPGASKAFTRSAHHTTLPSEL